MSRDAPTCLWGEVRRGLVWVWKTPRAPGRALNKSSGRLHTPAIGMVLGSSAELLAASRRALGGFGLLPLERLQERSGTVLAKEAGSSEKAPAVLQDLRVSRGLQKPQQYSAKPAVTHRQLHRVATWQRREAVTSEFRFVTQRITKSVIYCVSLHFASVSHLWVTNLRSCQLKGNFHAYFHPITAPPSPLLLPSLSERGTRVQSTCLSLLTCLHTLFFFFVSPESLLFQAQRLQCFPSYFFMFNHLEVNRSLPPLFPHDIVCLLTGFISVSNCTYSPLPCLVSAFSSPSLSIPSPSQAGSICSTL